jgi:O-antigen/teichoic acid export membrane protein
MSIVLDKSEQCAGRLAVAPETCAPSDGVGGGPQDDIAQPGLARPSKIDTRPRRGLGRPSYLLALLDQAVVSGTSFATSVSVGRAAGADELGAYALGFTLVVLVGGVQESLVSIPYTVRGARLIHAARSRYAGSSLLAALLLALLAGLAMAIGAAAVSLTGLARLAPVLATLSVTVPLSLAREFLRRFAFAHLRMGRALVIDAIVAVAQLGALAWLTATGRLSAVTAHASMGLACAIAAAVCLAKLRGSFQYRPRELTADWRRSWTFGRWVFAGQFTGALFTYAPHWLLAIALGAAATGEFAAGMTVVQLANPFIIGFANFLSPRSAHAFADGGAEEVGRVVVRSAALLAVLTAAFCLVVALLGGRLLALVFDDRYTGQAHAMTVLSLSLVAGTLGMCAENGLRALRHPRTTFTANLIALAVTLLAAAPLIASYGTLGAAYALLAGNLAAATARWWYFARLLTAARQGAPA